MGQLTDASFFSVKSYQSQTQPLKCCWFLRARYDFVLASPQSSASVLTLLSVSSGWDLRLSGRISYPTCLKEEGLTQGQIWAHAWVRVIKFRACFTCGSCVAFACCVSSFPMDACCFWLSWENKGGFACPMPHECQFIWTSWVSETGLRNCLPFLTGQLWGSHE